MRRSRLTRIALAVAFGLTLWELASGVGTVVVGFLGDREYAYARIRWQVGGHAIELDQLVTGVVSLLLVALVAALLLRRTQPPA
jgi:hypothetical protein